MASGGIERTCVTYEFDPWFYIKVGRGNFGCKFRVMLWVYIEYILDIHKKRALYINWSDLEYIMNMSFILWFEFTFNMPRIYICVFLTNTLKVLHICFKKYISNIVYIGPEYISFLQPCINLGRTFKCILNIILLLLEFS